MAVLLDAKHSSPTRDFKPFMTARHVLIALVVLGLLGVSAERLQLADMFLPFLGEQRETAHQDAVGLQPRNWFRFSEETVIESDREPHLGLFDRLETRSVSEIRLNSETLEMETFVTTRTVKVEPVGYLLTILGKMVETIEIAVWASLIAILLSAPLGWLGARNFTPHVMVYAIVRSVVAFLRAIPELISALLLVLVFGFGPVVGVLAMAFHSVGFLGKFFAEEIETADPEPQEALTATGAGGLTVLRLSVIPDILPNLTGLVLYILDRNIRMATVIGLVGAGGIGQELKGRYDLFQYDRVASMLLVIFLTVLFLDQVSARLRQRLV